MMIDKRKQEVVNMKKEDEEYLREGLREIREDDRLGYMDKLQTMREFYDHYKIYGRGGEKSCENSFSTTAIHSTSIVAFEI